DQVEDFPIIIPPYEQQKMFAAFAAQVDKSKVAVQAAVDKAQLLFDSLMQQYFG
ncbi:type I restriction enzyme, S subunit, partial [Lachnospiraceae bacterium NK3A20]